jgi:hypothetical protein
MATFYEADSIDSEIDQKKTAPFRIDQPCLAMWNEKEAWLCDPTNEGKKVSVEWNGQRQQVKLPEKGKAVSVEQR